MLRVGFAFLRLQALACSWSRILGVVRHGRDGSLIFFRDSPPPLSRPDIVTDLRSLALCQLALGVLSMSALEIIRDQGHSFSIHLFLLELMEIACSSVISLSQLNDFVLHSPFFIVPVAPVRQSIREGDFLASIRPRVCVSSVPALQDSWALLWLLSVRMVSQFVALCFSTVTYPLVFTWVAVVSPWAPSHGIPLLGYLPAGGPHLLGGRGHK